MKLSIDFAFEGFRIVRQRPQIILFWGLFLALGMVLGFGAFIGLAAGPFVELMKLSTTGGSANPQVAMAIFGQLFVPYIIFLLVMCVVQSIISCGVFRISLGHKNLSFGALRFGSDELRQVAVNIIFFLLFLVAYIALIIVDTILSLILSLILGALSQSLIVVGVAFNFVFLLGGILWLYSRMSLYAVQSFDQKKINMFGSWNLTSGNTGTLVLGYLLAGLLTVVVYILCAVVFGGVSAVLLMGHNTPPVTDPAQLVQAWTSFMPMVLLSIAMFWVILPLITAIFIGAPAAAYRQLTGNKSNVIDVF